MRLGDFLADLGRPAAYYPSLVRACGGVQAGLVLCQLAYWHGKQRDSEGWIRKSAMEFEEETGLTTREQQTGRMRLRRRGLLEERLRGIPATVEYRLKLDALDQFWDATSLANAQNQFGESAKLDEPIRQTISETTAETTAESTCARAASPKSSAKKPRDPTDPLQAADATSSKPQAKAELGAAFETFWKCYPPRRARRERKAEAWAEYLKLRPPPDLQARMLVAVRLYAKGNELPVDCCRWIKRRQWEDEVEVRVAKRVPVAGSTVADLIPDEKPDRSPEALAKVRAIRESLPWAK